MLCLTCIIAIEEVVAIEEVYEWQDSKGVRHFSTSSPHPESIPAKLPPIMREKEVKAQLRLEGCDNHGGVDCVAGSDEDGSAICKDGYRDPVTEFVKVCPLTAE